MAKRNIRDLAIEGKRILLRVDFNVPLKADGSIADDRRIREALPTLRYILEHGASAVVMSHLGRPSGKLEEDRNLRMDHVGDALRGLLTGIRVKKCDEVVGPKAKKMAEQLQPGEILLLENLRFDVREKQGDEKFALQLRELGDFYVNDAFGTCHRKDASMYAVAKAFPKDDRAIGFLVEKEIAVLDKLLKSPERPAVAVLGGAKIADKIGVIGSLLSHFDHVLVGGALAYTCLKAKGQEVGSSLVDNDRLPEIRKMEQGASGKLMLPTDHVIENQSDPKVASRTVESSIPDGWAGMDIGPRTIKKFCKVLSEAGTIVWNGPLGKFEEERFQSGTLAIAKCIASSRAVKIAGGGETSEALEKFGLAVKMTHVSTGGGAFLKYLEKGTLPALSVIEDK